MNRRLCSVAACGFLSPLFVTFASAPAAAQSNSWSELVMEADSIGPETPPWAPSRWIVCGANVQRADSVQISGGFDNFLLAHRSLRTRGIVSYVDMPRSGAGRFAIREILCDEPDGRPRTFVLERDHRYFYAVFSIRETPSFEALTFLVAPDDWRPFHWDPGHRTFTAGQSTEGIPAARATTGRRIDSLPAGTVVRIRPLSREPPSVTGALVRLDSTSLTLATGRDRERTFDFSQLRSVDRHAGQRRTGEAFGRGARRGALIGILVGATATTVAILAERRNPCNDCMISGPIAVGVLSVGFATLTTLVGGAIGAARRDQWTRVWPAQ